MFGKLVVDDGFVFDLFLVIVFLEIIIVYLFFWFVWICC